MTGRDVFYIAGAVVLLVVAKKAFGGVAAVGNGLTGFWNALTFNPESLGPGVELTPQTVQGVDQYIKLGYMARRADGSTYITPQGEAYIAQQKQNEQLTQTIASANQ